MARQSIDQVFELFVGNPAQVMHVEVRVVTNQDDGLASYAEGALGFKQGATLPQSGAGSLASSLKSTQPLLQYFNFRRLVIDPPGPGPIIGEGRQPFDANRTDKLGLEVRNTFDPGEPVDVHLTFDSWPLPNGRPNAHIVKMQRLGNLLVGLGPPLGSGTDNAGYMIEFHSPVAIDRTR
jgi:hypothetical protein